MIFARTPTTAGAGAMLIEAKGFNTQRQLKLGHVFIGLTWFVVGFVVAWLLLHAVYAVPAALQWDLYGEGNQLHVREKTGIVYVGGVKAIVRQ